MTHQEARQQAKNILSQKTRGPNGMLAYMLANATDQNGIPSMTPTGGKPEIYYAVIETDRAGIPVVTLPAGTQDVCATKDDEEIRVQLGKLKSLNALLSQLGIPPTASKNVAEVEEHVLATLLQKGYELKIETPYAAAMRETREEHGADIDFLQVFCRPQEFSLPVAAKRSLSEAEEVAGRKLFTMEGVRNLQDVGDLLAQMKGVEKTPQTIFATQVQDFVGGELVHHNGVEQKIPGREGTEYYEKGTYMTLRQMFDRLQDALPAALEEERRGNHLARMEIIATYDRLQGLQEIEQAIVKELERQCVAVSSGEKSSRHQETAATPTWTQAIRQNTPSRETQQLGA